LAALGSIKRSSRLPSCNMGPTSNGRGGEGKRGLEREKELEKGEGNGGEREEGGEERETEGR